MSFARLPRCGQRGPQPPPGPATGPPAGHRVGAGALAGLALVLLAPLAPGRAGQEIPTPVLGLLQHTLDALRTGDAQALAALVDFPRRVDELRWAGGDATPWADLDPATASQESRGTAVEWIAADAPFFRAARLRDFERATDPHAGSGPVPDRVILLVELDAGRDAGLRDLRLHATPAGGLLELTLAPAARSEGTPAPPPERLPAPQAVALDWPAGADLAWAHSGVEALLHSATEPAQAAAVLELARDPWAAAAALVRRLAGRDGGAVSSSQAALLTGALARLTERPAARLADPADAASGADRDLRLAHEIDGWVRWHARRGLDFRGPHLGALRAALLPPLAAAAGAGDPGPQPAPAAAPDAAPPPAAATGPGTSGQPAPEAPPRPPPAEEPPPSAPATPVAPPVRLRDPPETPPATPPGRPDVSALAEVPVLVAIPGEPPRRWTMDRLPDRLPAEAVDALAAVLAEWRGAREALGLRAAVGAGPAFMVLGALDDRHLAEATETLARAAELADVLLPAPAPKPIVALLFDAEGARGGRWQELVHQLGLRGDVRADMRDVLAREPRGFTARTRALLVQPTFDMAGDASQGDDEFRLPNELANKYLQVSAVARHGPLPEGLLWALGHLAELRLSGRVYQFNREGFVRAEDHEGWPGKAATLVRERGAGLSLAGEILAAGEPDPALSTSLLAWAAVEFLSARRPQALAALVEDLVALHARSRRPLSASFGGDRGATREILARHLDGLDRADLAAHLAGLP